MKNILLLIIALVAWCAPAKADVFQITSAPFNDGTHSVSPYQGMLNGQQVTSFCLELGHTVGFNTQYDVTVVNLHNFGGPLHDAYWEAGWIALQIQNVTDINILSAASRAIWLITAPSADAYLNTQESLAWVSLAAASYQSVSDSSFTLLLRSGDPGQSQLIVGQVPEPSAAAMFGIMLMLGLSGILFMRLKRGAK